MKPNVIFKLADVFGESFNGVEIDSAGYQITANGIDDISDYPVAPFALAK